MQQHGKVTAVTVLGCVDGAKAVSRRMFYSWRWRKVRVHGVSATEPLVTLRPIPAS